jgi:hypothetical protein
MIIDNLDLSNAAPQIREELLQEHLAALTAQPFVVAKPPLVRVTLLRLGASDRVVHFVFHPAICLARRPLCGAELVVFGGAKQADKRLRRWQVSGEPHKPSGTAQPQTARHRSAIGRTPFGAQTVLEIPTDRPRPQLQSLRGNQFRFALTPLPRTLCINLLRPKARRSSWRSWPYSAWR